MGQFLTPIAGVVSALITLSSIPIIETDPHRLEGPPKLLFGHILAMDGIKAMQADSLKWSYGANTIRHANLYNRTSAQNDFGSNREAMELYDFLTISNSTKSNVIKPNNDVNPIKLNKRYNRKDSLLELIAFESLKLHALVQYKDVYNGTERVLVLFKDNVTTPAELEKAGEEYVKSVAHHSTTLVPGMLDRIGAKSFSKGIAEVGTNVYGDSELTGAPKASLSGMDMWSSKTEAFIGGMQEYEATLNE